MRKLFISTFCLLVSMPALAQETLSGGGSNGATADNSETPVPQPSPPVVDDRDPLNGTLPPTTEPVPTEVPPVEPPFESVPQGPFVNVTAQPTPLPSVGSHAPVSANDRHRWVGIQFDVGEPDGTTLGVVVSPYFYWLKVSASGTYNGLAPGMRAGFTLDPIKFPVGLTLTGEVGHSFEGDPSTLVHRPLPKISYTYLNAHVGLEFGSPNKFRFFLRGGPTYISGNITNLNAVVNQSNVSVSDATFKASVFPAAKLGFTWLF